MIFEFLLSLLSLESSLIIGLTILAVLGFKSNSFLTAFEAFSFVLVSRSLPVNIKVIIIAAVSK